MTEGTAGDTLAEMADKGEVVTESGETALGGPQGTVGRYVPSPEDRRRDILHPVAHALSGTNNVTPKLFVEMAKAVEHYIETGA